MLIHSQEHTIDWSKINGIILDCDGVLTDGKIEIDDSGCHSRRFDMRDGLGLVRLQECGVKVAIVSSAPHTSILHRAHELKIKDAQIGVRNKLEAVMSLANEWGIEMRNLAFIGDDLVDLPPMLAVGFPITLQDAVEEVLEISCHTATKGGGNGGVREVCDLIINSKKSKP
jgi:3-deoxy-D-manno-octulosonate 8-phosphate phosphatase (KDO 8-P phosphatase)